MGHLRTAFTFLSLELTLDLGSIGLDLDFLGLDLDFTRKDLDFLGLDTVEIDCCTEIYLSPISVKNHCYAMQHHLHLLVIGFGIHWIGFGYS